MATDPLLAERRPGLAGPVGHEQLLRIALAAALAGMVVVVWSVARPSSAPAPALAPAPAAPGVISAPMPELRPDSVPVPGDAAPATPAPPSAAASPRLPEPGEPERPSSFVRYLVRPGDTLFDVSRALSVQIDDILQYNPTIDAAGRIGVGQVLFVPQFDR